MFAKSVELYRERYMFPHFYLHNRPSWVPWLFRNITVKTSPILASLEIVTPKSGSIETMAVH